MYILVAAVEVAHLSVTHVDRAHREARMPRVDMLQIDEIGQRRAQWRRRVIRGRLDPELQM